MKSFNKIQFASLAAIWCLLFGAINMYWLLGGNVGFNTLGIGMETQKSDPTFISLAWGAVCIKWMAGFLAISLNWKSQVKLKYRLTITFGLAMAVYGLYGLMYSLLMVIRIFPIPDWLGYSAAKWHLFLWSPFWFVGGLLFILAAWHFKMST